jgi:hypothetical protein
MEPMSEEKLEKQDATEAQEASEDYVAPKLTELGSFEELTGLGAGANPDAEGTSG